MSDATSGTTAALCPSAQPEWESSVTLGVIAGTADQPLMVHFATPQPVTDELLALSTPVTPTEVFRFAAPCMCTGCVHFADARCRLATRVVKLLPVVTKKGSGANFIKCMFWPGEWSSPALCSQDRRPKARERLLAFRLAV